MKTQITGALVLRLGFPGASLRRLWGRIDSRLRRGCLAFPGAVMLLLTTGCEKIITEINRTAYFGAGGCADTAFQFSNFFTNNHTLSCPDLH